MLRGELHRRTSLDLKQFIDKVRTIIHKWRLFFCPRLALLSDCLVCTEPEVPRLSARVKGDVTPRWGCKRK